MLYIIYITHIFIIIELLNLILFHCLTNKYLNNNLEIFYLLGLYYFLFNGIVDLNIDLFRRIWKDSLNP